MNLLENICVSICLTLSGFYRILIFLQDLLDLKLKFRGSKNQRVIDVSRSLEQNEVVWSSIVDDQASYVFRESPEIEMFAEEIKTFAEK